MLGRRCVIATHARRKNDLTTGNQRARKCLISLARREGFEPPTLRFEALGKGSKKQGVT